MKKFSVSGFYLFLAGLLSLAIILGCEQVDFQGYTGSGTLKIVLSDKMNNTKTIEPSISMTIASYDINGSTLATAQHRLDVIAITSDNQRAGSISFNFSVTE